MKGMLAAQTRPVIHFIRSEEVLGPKQFKHVYRFFIVNVSEIFNISGLVTAAFNVPVNDRSQCFSVNAMSADEDLKSFADAVRRFTEIPNVVLVDILTGANEVLDLVINPNMGCFLPDDNGSMMVQLHPSRLIPTVNPEEPL